MKITVDELEKYKLYVGRLQPIPEDAEFSFYSSKRGYLFVFTKMEQPEGFPLLDNDHYDELSAEEKAWLESSYSRIAYEWLKTHKPNEEEVLMNFLDDVEDRLKAMREQLLKGNDENEREREGTGDDPEIP